MLSLLSRALGRKMTITQAVNLLKFKSSKKSTRLSYSPIRLSIQMTNRCTFACDMCQTHSPKIPRSIYHYAGGKDMDFATFKDIVDRFRRAIEVSLIGTGEPLLNRDFFRMVEYASKKRNMTVSTVSNGLILDSKIEAILDSVLCNIEVSLNGHNAEEFNRMTGQKAEHFSTIHDNVSTLVERRNATGSKLKIVTTFILDRTNVKHVPEMISVAERLGVDEASFHNFFPSDAPGFTAGERCLYTDDKEVVDVLRRANAGQHKIKVNLPGLLDRSRTTKNCNEYFIVLRIDGEGDVGGCTGQLLSLAGNGKYYDNDVWNNDHFISRRKLFLDQDSPDLPPCHNCSSNNKPLAL